MCLSEPNASDRFSTPEKNNYGCDFVKNTIPRQLCRNRLKGGVQSFVNDLTRLKITIDRDIPMGLLF